MVSGEKHPTVYATDEPGTITDCCDPSLNVIQRVAGQVRELVTQKYVIVEVTGQTVYGLAQYEGKRQRLVVGQGIILSMIYG